MRLAAIASALAIVICAAVFGAILQKTTSVSGPARLPAQAAPEERQAAAVMPTDAPSPATNAAGSGTAPVVVAQAAPPPAPIYARANDDQGG